MALNKRLLRKVRNRIAKVPESYCQSIIAQSSEESPCGTVTCLLGEVVICSAPTIRTGIQLLYNGEGILRRGAKLLGVSYSDASEMFGADASGWPTPFDAQFKKAKTRRQQAKVAVAYLDECLKRGKVIW